MLTSTRSKGIPSFLYHVISVSLFLQIPVAKPETY